MEGLLCVLLIVIAVSDIAICAYQHFLLVLFVLLFLFVYCCILCSKVVPIYILFLTFVNHYVVIPKPM